MDDAMYDLLYVIEILTGVTFKIIILIFVGKYLGKLKCKR